MRSVKTVPCRTQEWDFYYNPYSMVKWLSWVAEKDEIDIEHVRNGGEKRIGKYSLDGYCEERNTVYEFQGCYWHGKNALLNIT